MRILLALAGALLASAVDAQSLRERMIAAEDSRPQTAEGLAPLMEGLKSSHASLRRQAVRGLGRLEREDLIATIASRVSDDDPTVRGAAYNALGQVARSTAAVADVHARMLAAMKSEPEAVAWGVGAATLGRLPYADAALVKHTEEIVAAVLPAPAERSSRPAFYGQADAMLGAARGLEALVRTSRKVSSPLSPTVTSLKAAAILEPRATDERVIRVRRLAWLALTTLGAVDATLLQSGVADSDEEVRRLAMAAAGADIPLEPRQAVLEKGLSDASPRVRYEALKSWGRQLQRTSCEALRAGLRDASPHVRLLAIDLLGNGCVDEAPTALLQALAEVVTSRPGEWHAPAHGLVALAQVAPAKARELMPRYTRHATWQVRMYAARAAGTLQAFDELSTLARDVHDNVREAAIAALAELKRPEAVTAALEALATRGDYQLLLTSARALSVVPTDQRPRARQVLVDALARLSADARETSRDPRMAILDRLSEMRPVDVSDGGDDLGAALRARLADFDPAVARRAADILQAWTGTPHEATPQRPPPARTDLVPLASEHDVQLRITMAGKGAFTMRLLLDDAPASAGRVLALAQKGYYNGLTFHRVAANFVIQGGSPGANEYMGDGPFMRDEVGLVSHSRGTVGISTRGRDTGDAQLFVNLIDSPRLDHIYTVLAVVVDGMDVIDAVIEGDVIDRVEVVGEVMRPVCGP
ncbi:MAG: HEAT repeat domain-containing protein [Vicinamibacterales bacterium]